MRIQDEVRVPHDGGEGMYFYLSERYMQLPPGCEPADSIFNQFLTQMEALGGVVYCKPPHPPNAFFVLLLCPGVFADGALTDEISVLLKTGRAAAGTTAGALEDAKSSDSIADGSESVEAGGDGATADEAAASGATTAAPPDRSRIIALFSTAREP